VWLRIIVVIGTLGEPPTGTEQQFAVAQHTQHTAVLAFTGLL